MAEHGWFRAKGSSSGFIGVLAMGRGFYGYISFKRRKIYTKHFPSPEEAARARDELAVKYHKDRAVLNFGPEPWDY